MNILKPFMAFVIFFVFLFSFFVFIVGTISTRMYFPDEEKVHLFSNASFMIDNHPFITVLVVFVVFFIIYVGIRFFSFGDSIKYEDYFSKK